MEKGTDIEALLGSTPSYKASKQWDGFGGTSANRDHNKGAVFKSHFKGVHKRIICLRCAA